jgi:hypothetical protein
MGAKMSRGGDYHSIYSHPLATGCVDFCISSNQAKKGWTAVSLELLEFSPYRSDRLDKYGGCNRCDRSKQIGFVSVHTFRGYGSGRSHHDVAIEAFLRKMKVASNVGKRVDA